MENSSTGILLGGVLFSSIGLGYFIYGKRQSAPVPLLCGVGLMVYPYFVSQLIMLIGAGIVLMAIPFLIKR